MVQGPRGQSLGELWKRGDAGKVGPAVCCLLLGAGSQGGQQGLRLRSILSAGLGLGPLPLVLGKPCAWKQADY